MDYESYRDKFFTKPAPEQNYKFQGLHGTTLYFEDYEAAVTFYSRVLGEPAYVEGTGTRGWQLGDTWLTLLRGKSGNPQNMELNIIMQTPGEADRLHAAFKDAGGIGEAASDELMYEPVRYCSVRDPFGTNILIICPLKQE
jgi:catechol 2,3-dioxygenase-like lactoylglutathione lyase family enzyme